MDSQQLRVAMWQELLHYVKCPQRSYISVSVVTVFLGLKPKISKNGWYKVDRFLNLQFLKPESHFYPTSKPQKVRLGMTLEAFIALLFGGGHLRSKDPHSKNGEEMEDNIKWLQKNIISMVHQSIINVSGGNTLQDENRFIHFNQADRPDIQSLTQENSASLRDNQNSGSPATASATMIDRTQKQSDATVPPELASVMVKEGHPIPSSETAHVTDQVHVCDQMHSPKNQTNCEDVHNKECKNSDRHDKSQVANTRCLLKSLNQRYKCKYCTRHFLHFFIFRRHVQNHKKKYLVSQARIRWRQVQGQSTNTFKTEVDNQGLCNVSVKVQEQDFSYSETNMSSSSIPSCASHNGEESSAPSIHDEQNVTRTTSAINFTEGMAESPCPSLDCFICNQQFQSSDALRRHVRSHNISNPYSCKLCASVFTSLKDLNMHMSLCHKERTCTICQEKFKSQKNLRTHLAQHAKVCKFCDRKFSSKQRAQDHERRIHLTEKTQFKCNVCDKEFVDKGWLERHHTYNTCQKLHVKCSLCSKVFSTRKCLKSHIKFIHEGVHKQHKCTICDMAFHQKYVLQKHMLVHIDNCDGQFLCKFCGKSYKRKHALKQHEFLHTGEVGKFCCEFCGKTFRAQNTFQVHLRVHTGKPYKCTECDMTFVHTSNLKQHSYTHTGEKPFQCKICQKNFRSGKSLKIHQQTHSPEQAS